MTKQNLKTVLQTAIKEAFSNNTPIVVWYDNGGTLQTLVETITPKDVELIKYQGSYLTIRVKIESEKDFKKQRLIYVPEKAPEPSWLRDYEIFGNRLDLDLATILNQYFRLPLDRELKTILTPANSRRLATRWDEILGDIEPPLTPDMLKQALLATIFEQPHQFDIKNAIFAYLKHHETLSEKLEKTNLNQIFLQLLSEQYGYKPAKNEQTPNPKRLAATILLTELVYNSGGLGEKEFSEILPTKNKRTFWTTIAQEWTLNEDYKENFVQWSEQIEKEYAIPAKVKGRPEIENVTSFKAIDEALLEEILLRIGNEGLKGIRKNLTYIKTIIQRRMDSTWSRLELFPEWKIINLSIKLLEFIQESLTSLEKAPEAKEILENYTKEDGWWQIDQLYREIATIDKPVKPKVKELFLDMPKEQYQEWLRKINNAFALAIEKQKKWQIQGVTGQREFWEKYVHPHREKVAIFFLDALRYELQKRLAETLQKTAVEVKHYIMLAALPSITEICMPALLPATTMNAHVDDGNINVTLDGKPALTKTNRITWLKEKFGNNITCLELKDLTKPPHELGKELLQARILAVMDRELDKAGSFITEELLDYFDKLLSGIKKAVEAVAHAGFNKIIITTDHGFLFYPLPNKIDIVESVPATSETIVSRRYCIGKPQKTHATITLTSKALPYLSEDTDAVFPVGTAWFPRPGPKEPFIHGGISLQECCVGILECTPKKAAAIEKVGVKVSLPSIISSAIFIISLQPIVKQISDQPRTVVVELAEKGETILRSEPVEIYSKEQTITMRLPKIPKEIEVKVKDSETEEVLFTKQLKVSLEGYDETL
ncbi:MAG: PglZ domain-containing protein [Candidatus Bathyarchaeia archaeon]